MSVLGLRPAELDAAGLGLGGKLAENVVHFAGFLRRAGMVVGSAQVLDALAALDAVGVGRRDDVFAALHAVFVSKREHDELFLHGFDTFWRDPFGAGEALAMLLPPSRLERPGQKPKLNRRLTDAWHGPGHRSRPPASDAPPEVELDTSGTSSEREVLRHKDFEQMTAEEEAEAQQILARMRFPWRDRPTRRTRPARVGARIDLRRTLAAARHTFGEPCGLRYLAPRTRPPPLVVLCDISGSMERYSRMMLRFLHALTNDRDRVQVFLFGTRLTPVTRALRHRDVDVAFDALSGVVQDWSGGTRIGACLAEFHRAWARRVLGQGAVVLLITDGLERESPEELREASAKLRRSCKRVIWLNPLLRFA
ncbi:MAG: VWA domain-containing protein, partial [Myxococcota bacterium]